MSTKELIEINPDVISNAVYLTVGEGFEHIDKLTDQPGYEWRTWCQDKTRMSSLIRKPLLEYRTSLTSVELTQLKLALQYLLNVDELVPYEAWTCCPELKAKEKGVGARYFASYQDTIQPYDWYAFCQWMWEILFEDEGWHTDIRNWVVVIPSVPVISLEPQEQPPNSENRGTWIGQKIGSPSLLSASEDMTKDDIQKLQIDIECDGESALSLMLCRDGTIARQGNGNTPPKKLSVMGMTEGAEFRQLMKHFDEQVFSHQGVFDYSNKKGTPIRYSIALIGEKPNLCIFEFRLGLENKDVGDLLPYFDSLIKKAVVLTEPWYAKALLESQTVQMVPKIEVPIQKQKPWWRVW